MDIAPAWGSEVGVGGTGVGEGVGTGVSVGMRVEVGGGSVGLLPSAGMVSGIEEGGRIPVGAAQPATIPTIMRRNKPCRVKRVKWWSNRCIVVIVREIKDSLVNLV
jgi:hypothetical protein